MKMFGMSVKSFRWDDIMVCMDGCYLSCKEEVCFFFWREDVYCDDGCLSIRCFERDFYCDDGRSSRCIIEVVYCDEWD